MPALNFDIELPDGEVMTCYSPSTAAREFFRPGEEMTIAELIDTTSAAFQRVGQRVEQRFGVECVVAARQRLKILRRVRAFGPEELVRILDVREHPL